MVATGPDGRLLVGRMAQETAVHRVDVQSAFGAITPIEAELAVDGFDEVLVMMLAGDWSDEPQPGPSGTVVVAAANHAWRIVMFPDQVTVGDVTSEAEAGVTGEQSNLLRWLWGRAPDTAVLIDGDPAAASRLRDRLSLATQ